MQIQQLISCCYLTIKVCLTPYDYPINKLNIKQYNIHIVWCTFYCFKTIVTIIIIL